MSYRDGGSDVVWIEWILLNVTCRHQGCHLVEQVGLLVQGAPEVGVTNPSGRIAAVPPPALQWYTHGPGRAVALIFDGASEGPAVLGQCPADALGLGSQPASPRPERAIGVGHRGGAGQDISRSDPVSPCLVR